MSAGAEGVMVGWLTHDGEPHAIVNFWDGGPLRVPVRLLVEVRTESD
jgi:hypothetical protein